ncbi:TPA: hypothetical protein OMU28_004062 [Klebsiella aerogenes]|nr:hypothetical protein [Klebsiella aerogenes]
MRSNNEKHNKYFSVDADVSPERITKAEGLIMDRYSNIYSNWKEKDKNYQREAEEVRQKEIAGFKNILPVPFTLSDVTLEWDYWEQVLDKRYKTKNGDGYVQIIWDRRWWLSDLLFTIKPVNRAEALSVCKWVLACDYFEERDSLFDSIILNLVGECDNA